MVKSLTADVLILVFAEPPGSRFAAWADERDYPLIQVDMVRPAVAQVRNMKPRVVVVHVSTTEALTLIDALYHVRPRVPVIAVPARHCREVEQCAREAGATVYHPDDDDPEGLAVAIEPFFN